MILTIPDFVLIAIDGATRDAAAQAARVFEPGEQLPAAPMEALLPLLKTRLAARELTVVDITSMSTDERQGVRRAAREAYCKVVALLIDAPGRPVRDEAVRRLQNEGFRRTQRLPAEELGALRIKRTPLICDRRGDAGPFDIIGDIHGCFEEVELLLQKLGYAREQGGHGAWIHPAGRRALFLGDLCDRGPRVVEVYQTVMAMVERGSAICLAGNHDEKLAQLLSGRKTRVTKGVSMTIAQLEALGDQAGALKAKIVSFVDGLSSHYSLDGGKLVVAHGGLIEPMHNRHTGITRAFGIYGDTTGELDKDGFPVRRDWAQDYRGKAVVVYGHTVVTRLEWVNNTLDIDTGCVFGGWLTALRYPELEVVQQRAVRRHYHGKYVFD